VIRPDAVTNKVRYPLAQALTPRATARCVLPTPGGPSNSTFSALAMKRHVPSSRSSFGSSEGWNVKSKLSMVFTTGRRAIATRIDVFLSCLPEISLASNSSRKSLYDRSRLEACSSMAPS